mgnify:CR=1 FL=1
MDLPKCRICGERHRLGACRKVVSVAEPKPAMCIECPKHLETIAAQKVMIDGLNAEIAEMIESRRAAKREAQKRWREGRS